MTLATVETNKLEEDGIDRGGQRIYGENKDTKTGLYLACSGPVPDMTGTAHTS